MVVRKNISLDKMDETKLKPLIIKNNNNFSGAIRDAIDIADIVLKHYGSIGELKSAISSMNKKELTPREESIISGKNVLIPSPIFQWMLIHTKGILLDREIINELFDPLNIKTISEFDKILNKIISEFGWRCKVLIHSMDNISPSELTIIVEGENQHHRNFMSQLVVLFFVYNRCHDINTIERRATSIRIDLKMNPDARPLKTYKEFGYLKEIMNEFNSKEDMWKALIEIYSCMNYNMSSYYEGLIAPDSNINTSIYESLSRKQINYIPHKEFLEMLKKIYESMKLVDKIEIDDEKINIFHTYNNKIVKERLKEYYIKLLKENGYEYKAEGEGNLIVLRKVK